MVRISALPGAALLVYYPVCPTVTDTKRVPHPRSIRVSICGLEKALTALLNGEASPAQVKSIIRVCHSNAEGALARRGHLTHLLRLHGLSLTDLAFDCISDLFARDNDGRYKALESYFSAYEVVAFTDEDVYFHLQRLSFTKVRNGLFRLYSEMDPQLARILHNIKVAARTLGFFIETDRLGESCLVPSLCDTSEHLPPVDVPDLTAWLSAEASGNEFIPELLGKLSMSLRKQTSYSRIVPVVSIGLAIRAFYNEKEIPRLAEPATVVDDGAIDVGEAISEAIHVVKTRTYSKYVKRGKVSPGIFELYFQVIRQMFELRFVGHDGDGFQLSENFLLLAPEMTPEEYRKKHRNRVEYLARLVQKRVSRTLSR